MPTYRRSFYILRKQYKVFVLLKDKQLCRHNAQDGLEECHCLQHVVRMLSVRDVRHRKLYYSNYIRLITIIVKIININSKIINVNIRMTITTFILWPLLRQC